MKVFHAHGFALHPAPRIGVRESRRVLGETVITEQDLVESRVPDDAVAWAACLGWHSGCTGVRAAVASTPSTFWIPLR